MLNEFPEDFIDLRESPIGDDFFDIENKVEEFYITIDFDDDFDLKTQCLNARNYLDSARILLRNLVDPEENQFIKEYPKRFNWMLDNLGRIDKKIDEVEVETIEKLDDIERLKEKDYPNSPKIKKYINLLIKCMEHLVIYPLKKSYQYYLKHMKESDKELFLYKVFIELYNSSESLGAISSEKQKTFPRQQIISSTASTHDDFEDTFYEPEELKQKKLGESAKELINNLIEGDVNDKEDFESF